MTAFFKKKLSRSEILGYLIFVAGFALLQIRGGFTDTWVEVAVFAMAAGAIMAGRSSGHAT